MINATLIGRIGRDVELRHTSSGDAVATIPLAVNYGKTGQDGKKPTQWFDCSLWGKRAESLQQYLTKGTQVALVVSDLHGELYEGKNGSGYKLACRVVEVALLGGSQQADKPSQAQQQRQAPAPARKQSDDFEDDIPF